MGQNPRDLADLDWRASLWIYRDPLGWMASRLALHSRDRFEGLISLALKE
jgi:hypothetical protein